VVNKMPTIQGVQTDGTNGAFKSLNYTSLSGAHYGTQNDSRNAFMFLQEVAIGRGEIVTRACYDQHRPNGWDAGRGNDFIYAAAGGVSTLAHDELVTFDQDAQVFRYLVEIELV
jgi:hypothetical protein